MTKRRRKWLPLLLTMALSVNCLSVSPITAKAETSSNVTVNEAKGWLESAYVTWQPVSGAEMYEVYYKNTSSDASAYTLLNDMLIRNYGTYYRADALGLPAGSYDIKVTAKKAGTVIAETESRNIAVASHVREGFSFSKESTTGGIASGGYDNATGAVPSNAQILYVTKDNVNTITLDVITSSSGKTTSCKGLANIMATRGKGYDTTPLIVRVIGTITDSDIDGENSSGYLEMKKLKNITLEGVGEDATLYGFGLLLREATNVEVRNLGFMMFKDDGISMDTGNKNLWIHNNDIFYGAPGSDKDQVKGDGSCDMKKASSYITVAYNHFWESGKASLCGLSESAEFFATYHHNWFDHSDSRHPRIRTGTIHIYNNYYDGIAKYGVGVTTGSSAFVEANVFRNCKYPMLSSKQGQDDGTFSGEDGGMIKAYNNEITGGKGCVWAHENSTDFDAYLASSRDERVPSTYKTKQGGTTYNNFDTDSTMYAYEPTALDNVVANVSTYAGRIDNGDFEWEFNDATDDESYDVNTALKSALLSYKSKLVSVGGTVGSDAGGNTDNGNTGNDNTGNDNTGNDNTGNDNTGNDNTGNDNTGNDNTGNDNTENDNTGNDNTGNDNTGNDNTGNSNTNNGQTLVGSLDLPSEPVTQDNGFVAGGWFETIYAQWADANAANAKAFYKLSSASEYIEVADELLRQKDNGIGRVDIVGLTPGTYDIKVEKADGTVYTQSGIKVSAYDRSGYAHHEYTSGIGAYKDDGTLKENAIVLYVTDENKDTVQIPGYESYATGIGNILNGQGNSKPLFTKLATDGKALAIRFVGTVNAPEGLTGYDSTVNGGTEGDNGNMAIIRNAKNITLEGIGTDATIYGWGISFYVTSGYENTESYEVRNLTFTKAPEDELGFQGYMNGSELTDPIERVWVHHNSFYPGYCANPAESDKAEGDGSCDFKRGQYFTMAYNYYEGCHKTNLLGASDSNLQFHVTMHHNYYKDCASRMPLVRQTDIHIYNNYFCGGTSKNVDARANAFVYSEANYYDSCKNPVLVTSGAVTKSYLDVFYNCTEDNLANIVTDRTKTLSSSSTYANFDTNASIFYYDATNKRTNVTYMSDAGTAKVDCKALSGVMKAVENIDMTPEKESMLANNPKNNMVLPYSINFVDKTAGDYAGTKMASANVSKLAKNTNTEFDNMIIVTSSDYSQTSTSIKFKSNGVTFKVGERTKVTLAEPSSKGSYAVVLYDAYGEEQLSVEDGEASVIVPAGSYMIQTSNAQKEGYLQLLKLEAAPQEGGDDNGNDSGDDSGNEQNPTVNVTSVALSQTTAELTVGEEITLTATVLPEDATNKAVTFSTSNADVVVVDANGKVTAKAAGTETITVTTADGSKTASCNVTVKDEVVAVTGVTLSQTTAELTVGGEITLTATVLPENATNKAVAFSTSNADVVAVDANGKVTAKAAGTETITVTTADGSKKASCVVTVVAKATSITLDKTNVSLNKGETLQLNATVLPENAIDKSVTFKSSDDAIVAVSDTGLIKALGKGTAKITAKTVNGVTAECQVTVCSPVTGVMLSDSAKTMVVGSTITLTATVQPEEADNKNVTWHSEGESVAKVDNNGNVTALSEGTAKIIATTQDGNKTAECVITVVANTVPVTGIEVSETTATLNVGQNKKFEATITPEDATDKNVKWESSDVSIAEVDNNGTVTAKAAGTVVITAVSTSNEDIKTEIALTILENEKPVTGIELADKTVKDIAAGKELQLSYNITPSDATVQDVLWKSSDESIAKVEADGRVVALQEGSAVISVLAKGAVTETTVIDTIMVTVYNPVQTIEWNVNPTEIMTVGQKQRLSAKAVPVDATYTALNYESSDGQIVNVDATGQVTALKKGTATITITSAKGEAKKEVTITVKQPEISNPSFGKAFENVNFDSESEWSEVKDAEGKKAEYQISNVTTSKIPAKGFAVTATIAIPGVKEKRPEFDGKINMKVAARLGADWDYVTTKDMAIISSGDLYWSEESGCYYADVEVVFEDDIEKYVNGVKQDVHTFEEAFTDAIQGISFECAGYKCTYEGDIYLSNVALKNAEGQTPGNGEGDEGSTPGTGEGDEGSTPGTGNGNEGSTPGTGEGDEGSTPGTGNGNENPTPGTGGGNENQTPGTGSGSENLNPEDTGIVNGTIVDGESTLAGVTELIASTKSEKDFKGATYNKLSLRVTKSTKTSQKLKWNKVKGAEGYVIFASECGENMQVVATITKGSTTSYTHKKLNKATYYKYVVVAYQTIDGKQVAIATSKNIHVPTTGGKNTDIKFVKVNKAKVTLKKGKTFKLKASEVKKDSKKKITRHRKLSYETSNTKIATVSKSGKVKAKAKGTCYIYIYAQNGVYKKVRVNVK